MSSSYINIILPNFQDKELNAYVNKGSSILITGYPNEDIVTASGFLLAVKLIPILKEIEFDKFIQQWVDKLKDPETGITILCKSDFSNLLILRTRNTEYTLLPYSVSEDSINFTVFKL